MKKILLILLTVTTSLTFAQKYDDGKLILTDGTIKKGFVETTMGEKFVRFKTSEKGEPEKVNSETIKTIVYLEDDKKTTEVEYDRIKIYKGLKGDRISDPQWFQVVERGIVTLYVKGTSMQGSISNPNSSAGFLDYYVIRKGEPAAKVIANIASFNNNATFRSKAPEYFKDYPQLAEKIKSKEYTYKDLVAVVKEYNQWAGKKKK